MNDLNPPRFRGICMGVDVVTRGENDPHILIQVWVEDDEIWHRKASISSHWLPELIRVLQDAHAFCESQEPDLRDGRQYGWKFREVE